jgi:geranylgeranyl diphosphate synthase type II
VTSANDSLGRWLGSRRQSVDGALQALLPLDGPFPEALRAAMAYSLFGAGKRLRPMLVLAAAEACGERVRVRAAEARRLAMPAACAIEMIHTYSLIHDDLPAMDNDSMRRGRPTSHVVFGEDMAILAGDALLTEAFALLSRRPARAPGRRGASLGERKLRVIQVIAQAAGAAGMVGGQVLDVRAAAPDAAPLDRESLQGMHMRKTGALIRAAALAGAIMAGADDRSLKAIATYGQQIGLAFQIVDDILDVEGTPEDLGKTPGKDAAAGKPTYPALLGLDESRRLASTCLARALAALARVNLGGQLPAIARWVVARTH